jgi:DNA polymerase-3 subunit epsilon
MREIVFDTETTGFGAEDHRIIEIGCVELVNRVPTGRTFQKYLNPERPIDFGSQKVHGISDEMVKDAPKFRDIVEEFLAFIGDAQLVAHNADFDMGFLNAELARCNYGKLENPVVDTLLLARQKLPGQRHGLDSLCKFYNVDNSARTYHGALLDSQLLADVYVELMGGLQATLELTAEVATVTVAEDVDATVVVAHTEETFVVVEASADEIAAHGAFVRGSVPAHKWGDDVPAAPAA